MYNDIIDFGTRLQIKKKDINHINTKLALYHTADITYDSSDKSFSTSSPKYKFVPRINLIPELPLTLNKNIIFIYNIIGARNKELYLNDWTLLSIEEALFNYKYLCDNNQKNVFDIAHIYLGMGHIKVLSCDLTSHLLFYRPDGGSNGHESTYNFNNLILNGSGTYKQFTFLNWFSSI